MQKNTLTFHLAPANREDLDFDETDRYSQNFIKSLGLKVHSGCWSDIELDSPIIRDFLKETTRRVKTGEAIFYGCNSLSQKLIETEEDLYDWYILRPKHSIDMTIENNTISCKAYKIANNIDATHGSYYNPFVSEKFVETCKENALTGIEFLWCIDNGKYQARQWYIPIAQKPLGRGIDHPWFDPKSLAGPNNFQPISTVFRRGVYHFKNNLIKEDAIFDDKVLEDIHRLFLPFSLYIDSYRRYLRDYLPSTDFAYMWGREDERQKFSYRERELCLNRRAKEYLIKADVIKEHEIEPILIHDELPPVAILLDSSAEMPCPFYTEDELIELRAEVEKKWDKHIKTEKPLRKVTIKEALMMLRQAKKENPGDFQKGTRKDKLDSRGVVLPNYWIDILSISNGCTLDADCELLPANQIKNFNEEKQNYIQSIQEDYPYDYIAVGYGADGDWFALDKSESFETDCKVLRISHEDLSIVDSLDSIPFFISEVLSGYYD